MSARRVILERRAAFIAAAVASIGAASGCDDRPRVCLSAAPEDAAKLVPGTALPPPPADAAPRPCLTESPEPCLSIALPHDAGPRPIACLSVARPRDGGTGH